MWISKKKLEEMVSNRVAEHLERESMVRYMNDLEMHVRKLMDLSEEFEARISALEKGYHPTSHKRLNG